MDVFLQRLLGHFTYRVCSSSLISALFRGDENSASSGAGKTVVDGWFSCVFLFFCLHGCVACQPLQHPGQRSFFFVASTTWSDSTRRAPSRKRSLEHDPPMIQIDHDINRSQITFFRVASDVRSPRRCTSSASTTASSTWPPRPDPREYR